MADAEGEPWRHRPQNYSVVHPKNRKWWKKMDRVSFRKVLEECVATGKVSSVLRKVCIALQSIDGVANVGL